MESMSMGGVGGIDGVMRATGGSCQNSWIAVGSYVWFAANEVCVPCACFGGEVNLWLLPRAGFAPMLEQ